jgi:hypothetical protein
MVNIADVAADAFINTEKDTGSLILSYCCGSVALSFVGTYVCKLVGICRGGQPRSNSSASEALPGLAGIVSVTIYSYLCPRYLSISVRMDNRAGMAPNKVTIGLDFGTTFR